MKLFSALTALLQLRRHPWRIPLFLMCSRGVLGALSFWLGQVATAQEALVETSPASVNNPQDERRNSECLSAAGLGWILAMDVPADVANRCVV